MFRKIFCYLVYLLELFSLNYIIYDIIDLSYINIKLFKITINILILNIPTLLFSIFFFGTPNNKKKEYFIKHISYRYITEDKKNIILNYQNGIWVFSHYGKSYLYNLRGWINVKKRVIDIIFIQLHNSYCDAKKIINRYYYKNFFRKYDIKVIFIKDNKQFVRKFKPSFMLKLKMILSISRFKYQKDHSDDVWKRDLFDTFMIH